MHKGATPGRVAANRNRDFAHAKNVEHVELPRGKWGDITPSFWFKLQREGIRYLTPHTLHPVIDIMDEQREIVDMGGTMRLGVYPAKLEPGSVVARAYAEELVYERHRHRYEVNNRYRTKLEEAGLHCSGTSPDDRLVEFVELSPDVHPFFVATQAHPEFKSRPNRPHPLFAAFVRAAAERAEGRAPRLPMESLDLLEA